MMKWSIPGHLVFTCITAISPFGVAYLISKRQNADDLNYASGVQLSHNTVAVLAHGLLQGVHVTNYGNVYQ